MKQKETCGTCKQEKCTCIVDGKGKKNDLNKLRWDLLPIEQVEKIVEILTIGAEKYSDNNWMQVEDGYNRYYAALMRHLVAYRKGEKIDKDSGKSHLAHAGCCLLFLMFIGDKCNLIAPGDNS
jgi:mannose/cellobiose epimerase-like protein (N-acyl-D-glucosamine 2-epimerase family)